MGFPINYLLQLLQSVTYHFLPVDGGKCTFLLFNTCQSHCNNNNNNCSMSNNGSTTPLGSPLTLDNLSIEEVSNKTQPATMPLPINPRALAYPTIVYETRKNPPAVKHSLAESSNGEAQPEDDVQRSMARRKKNEPPMDINKKCSYCDKVFKRPCDFTKHEKTHSRPWKCPVEDCKYYETGWPTEKERDRHVNDRHSVNPPAYNCKFSPCTYTSKRESNLKQHMEKAHGWTYVRSKKNGKRGQTPTSASESSPNQTTPPTPNMPLTPAMSTPVSSLSTELPSPASGHMPSPYNQHMSANEPVIYRGNYVDGYTNMANGQPFNFADPPMMSGYDYSDFQLFPSGDLDNISLDPVPQATIDDFSAFNQTLDTSNAHELTQPPSADMSLDQLGQDSLNPYCFDNEFYNYQSNGMADFQPTNGMPDYQSVNGMADFQSANGMPDFHTHNGMPEY
ncbi:C2H2 transcription factor (Ace1), putative [Talaromyces stipitatus ATCC 10500]|uniref:C2H2 transcription factor (Ace1), putative n=1 Tax=Talaromyces stipitatus (strain ATCC 10500 / CBS 375.48 / QM 6759 / NRRL 1006) TaxID=441959 RepID=B8MTG3_TALSN|nr:C2H2 transcription factor (Ace1), putative [Talaromyces stipitatus ATCC 10500]EED12295.1 C2H2 transcription factor (Ace1), putative [Talaromyces stipitatus ATCC 10500]